MFGGLTFMVAGNVCCGVLGEDLMVRVGADLHQDALTRPHVREAGVSGRAVRGTVYVGRGGGGPPPPLGPGGGLGPAPPRSRAPQGRRSRRSTSRPARRRDMRQPCWSGAGPSGSCPTTCSWTTARPTS